MKWGSTHTRVVIIEDSVYLSADDLLGNMQVLRLEAEDELEDVEAVSKELVLEMLDGFLEMLVASRDPNSPAFKKRRTIEDDDDEDD